MERDKRDKQFMIKLDQSNRDFLTNSSMFIMTFIISTISLLLATFSVIYSINGLSLYTLIVGIIFGTLMLILLYKFLPSIKRGFNDSKKANEQLQKELFELYPEYKNKIH